MTLPAGKLRSQADAAAMLRPDDTLGIPLGPGQPAAFLHALGERDDWADLPVFGALLVDLYELFTPARRPLPAAASSARPSGSCATSGADIEFVPADFRRFAPIARARSPRG